MEGDIVEKTYPLIFYDSYKTNEVCNFFRASVAGRKKGLEQRR